MAWIGLFVFLFAGILSGNLEKEPSRWLKGSSIGFLVIFTVEVLQYLPPQALPIPAVSVIGAAIYVSRLSGWHEWFIRWYRENPSAGASRHWFEGWGWQKNQRGGDSET
jgi:hypothetical protein